MTAATVPPIPGPPDGPGMTESADDHDLTLTWAELHRRDPPDSQRTGQCARPVRLKGRIDAVDLATGELRPVYDSGTEPGGALLTACGNRRESVCPPCSRSTSATPASSSAQGCPAARASPTLSPSTRACLPRSPRRRSGRSTPGGRAARPCCPADPAATTSSAAVRTAATSPARVGPGWRPAARPAAVPGLLRLPGGRAVQRVCR